MYMKYQFRNIGLLPLLLFLLPFFLCTCVDEEPVGPLPGDFKTVDFHLMLSNEESSSPEKSGSYEGMRDVMLVLTDAKGEILLSETYSIDWEPDAPAVTEKVITLEEVPKEATYVYAFSNLTSEFLENSKEILDALQVGKVLPVTFNGDEALVGEMPHAKIKGGDGLNEVDSSAKKGSRKISKKAAIPMSSHFHKLDAEEISIPLYRMIAKVKVSLQNMSGEDIEIYNMTLENAVNSNSIYTLPYKSLINLKEDDPPLFPDNSVGITTLSGLYNNWKVPNNESTETICYLQELTLSGLKKNIQVMVQFVQGTGTTPKKYGVTRFTYVRRNDYLVIPLVVSNYALNVTISEQRAPIGGYPFKYEMDLIANQEHYIKKAGELTINLEVVKKNIAGDDTSVEDFTVQNWELKSENEAITWLDKNPPEDSIVDEVKLMVHRKGTATLSFNVVINNDSSTTIHYSITLIYN